ncbi:hypothetical protein AZZ77_002160, partial [Klebsiella pneumoniae]
RYIPYLYLIKIVLSDLPITMIYFQKP